MSDLWPLATHAFPVDEVDAFLAWLPAAGPRISPCRPAKSP